MKTVLVTTTFYRNPGELRFLLARKMVKEAVEAGYTIVIVDASPIKEIGEKLQELGARVFPQLHKGMGASRREVFFHGCEIAAEESAETILWLEAEKVGLAPSIPKIVRPIEEDETTIVIPRRSEASQETWPGFQIKSEREANAIYNQVAGLKDFDPMFGPVAFHAKTSGGAFALSQGLNDLVGVEDTYVQLFVPLLCHLAHQTKLVAVEVEMTYPPEQKAEEESVLSEEMKQKRRWQQETITRAWSVIGLRHSLNKP